MTVTWFKGNNQELELRPARKYNHKAKKPYTPIPRDDEWSDEEIAFLKANTELSSGKLALKMSAHFQEKFTRNSIISKRRRLK